MEKTKTEASRLSHSRHDPKARSNTWQKALFDSLPTPVAVIDTEGVIVFTNQAWKEAFTASPTAFETGLRVGENYLQACEGRRGDKPGQGKETAEKLRELLSAKVERFDLEYVSHTTSEQRWFRLTATPMRDADSINAVLMHIDITEHKRAQTLMEEFSHLGQKLSSASTPKEAARIIMGVADQIWGWDCGYIHLFNEATSLVHPILTFDIINGQRMEVPSVYAGESRPSAKILRVVKEGAQLILRTPENMKADGLLPFGDTTRLSASIMVAPVRNGKKVTGILSVDSYSFDAYTKEDLVTLQSLADHCGGALERIWAQEALRESETQLRALASRLQSVREEEGIRIAREIHDELGQAMTGLKIDLLWLEKKITKLNIPAAPLIEKTRAMVQLTDQTIKSVRRISTALRPGILDDLGLLAAIEWQTREFQTRTKIRCDLSLPQEPITLDQQRASAVFRIFQEILTNIARHAGASRAWITFKKNEEITLQVRDNGKGITSKEVAGTKSLGLLGMRERALLFGGKVEIKGRKQAGTTVSVRIPLPADSDTQ